MGALPKNKITRVEQGKRRRGNAPTLKRDLNSAVPSHKQGFVAELMRFVGRDTATKVAPTKSAKETATAKTKDTHAQEGIKPLQSATKVGRSTRATVNKVRKTVAKSGK